MKQITVLVTGIGSCGPGEGTVKALKMKGNKYRIIGTDMNPLSAFSYLVDKAYLVPKASDSNYIPTLNAICKKERVDVLIPNSDAEVYWIANHREEIIKGVFLMLHPVSTVNIASDKWETYLWLKRMNFNYIPSFLPLNLEAPSSFPLEYENPPLRTEDVIKMRNLYPLFVKPRFAGGSKSAYKANNEEEMMFYVKKLMNLGYKPIIQRYIGSMDDEYTTGVLLSPQGEVISAVTFKRTLIAGASGTMIFKEYPLVTGYAVKIAKALAGIGSINIQTRLYQGQPYTLEINPRFSGSTPARAGVGVNEVDLAIDMFYLNKKVSKPSPKYNQVICRAFQEVFVPEEKVKQLERGKGINKCGGTYEWF